MEALTITVFLLWIAPIVVAHNLGKRRNRTGWPYGFLLGWVGVLILSLTSYLPSVTEQQVRELEAQRRLDELQGAEPETPHQVASWLSLPPAKG